MVEYKVMIMRFVCRTSCILQEREVVSRVDLVFDEIPVRNSSLNQAQMVRETISSKEATVYSAHQVFDEVSQPVLNTNQVDDTESCKILGLSQECSLLLEICSGSASSRVLIKHDYFGCSFSEPINNRYVYMVGGESQSSEQLTSDVFFYDLIDHKRYQGPSIITPTWAPTLIVLGSKLFVFYHYKSDSLHLCEVLDTASKPAVWRLLETCPNLPFDREYDPFCYFVVSYAAHFNDQLFLSLGDGDTSFSVCYNHLNETWSNTSEMPLPFYSQGKFVDDICYGFPKPDNFNENFNCLASYKLAVDWESSDPNVSCQLLAKYSLSISPLRYRYFLHSFFALSSNVFIITREKQHGIFNPRYTLEVDVVQLLSPDSAPSLPNSHSEGSSQVLNHTSISLHGPLKAILGDYNK